MQKIFPLNKDGAQRQLSYFFFFTWSRKIPQKEMPAANSGHPRLFLYGVSFIYF